MERNSAGLRLLVVDDDVLVRWSIAESLKESGDVVVEAADPSAAVKALADRSAPIDAILLDYRLAESDGLALLATIRQMAPRIPVVMMTAFGSPELSLKAIQMGACEVVAKPFDMSDLASMVRRACGGQRQ